MSIEYLTAATDHSMSALFLNTLTPKFYVALTGTSSLISGLILIFEWWYFRKYGTSFIEQISLTHISPLLGGGADDEPVDELTASTGEVAGGGNGASNGSSGGSIAGGPTQQHNTVQECKVWRNPFSLLRGSEYNRYKTYSGQEPLTYYDMNLSAQDHQTFFTCESDAGKPEYELMQYAWRERNPDERINKAKEALERNPDCASAMILLAEEESTTILEADKILRAALKCAETAFRRTQSSSAQLHVPPSALNAAQETLHRRDTNVYIYIRRRLAMCARKLGKLKEAIKLMKDLIKEYPNLNLFNIHENLLECYLEAQQYADAQAFLSKYDNISYPKSASICYTAALLKARQVSEKFSLEMATKRGLNNTEMAAVEAIHRAVEFNPHVAKYLLEVKPVIFPPEHILKRGDSEAVSYSFNHLSHWKRVDGALNLLHCTWEGTFRLIPYPLEKGNLFYPYPTCTEAADRELLPLFHDVSVYPKKELPFFILFTAGLCSFTALLALLTHQYPNEMGLLSKQAISWMYTPVAYLFEKVEALMPLMSPLPGKV